MSRLSRFVRRKLDEKLLGHFVRKSDLENFVKRSDLEGVIRRSDMDGLVRKPDLKDFVRRSDLLNLASRADLLNFARRSDIDNLFIQLSYLSEIRELLPGVQFGPLRGWSLCPDTLLILIREILSRSAPSVLEFGAGESTIALAATLQRLGGGKLLTIEHDGPFAENVASRLKAAGLDRQATIKVVPLLPYPAGDGFEEMQSYDLRGVDADFDVALVDGPIAARFGSGTRWAPLMWCLKNMRSSAVIYLDDATRSGEQSLVRFLQAAWPNIEMTSIPAEKGLVRMTERVSRE